MIGDFDIEPDGALILLDHNDADPAPSLVAETIWRVGNDGLLQRVAGGCPGCPSDDGRPALESSFGGSLRGLEIDQEGRIVYLVRDVAQSLTRVRSIDAGGRLSSIIGREAFPSEDFESGGDGGHASGGFTDAEGIAVGPRGLLLLDDLGPGRRLRLISGADGYIRDGDERIVPDPDGEIAWVFDVTGRHLRTVDTTTGRVERRFEYDGDGRLTRVLDGEGQALVIERDGSGAPVAVRAPSGARSVIGLDADDRLDALSTPAGRASAAAYAGDGMLATLTDAAGGAHGFGHDSRGRLESDRDPDGGTQTLTETDGEHSQTVEITTELGRSTTYRSERLPEGVSKLTRTEPDGRVVTTTRRPDGAVAESDGARTATMMLQGDPRFGPFAPFVSRLETEEGTHDPVVLTSTRAATGPLLAPATLTAEQTTPLGTSTSGYDGATRTQTTTSPAGRTTTANHDAEGRWTEFDAPGLAAFERVFGAGGRVDSETQDGRTTAYAYDAANHVTSITEPGGRTVGLEYDADGYVTAVTDREGARAAVERDGRGAVTALTLPGGAEHELTRTPAGRLASHIAPGGHTTSFTYDDDGGRTGVALPGGRTQTLGHDAAGRLSSLTTAEAATTVGWATAGDQTPTFTLTRTPEGAGTAQRLDLLQVGSRPTRLEQRAGASVVGTSALRYDEDTGLPDQHTVTGGGRTRIYPLANDADGLRTLTGPITLRRDGPVGASDRAGDDRLVQDTSFDAGGRITGRTTTVNGIEVHSWSLTRNAAGHFTGRTEQLGADPAETLAYEHDDESRLTAVKRGADTVEAYAYDARGNRTSRRLGTDPAEAATYTLDDRIQEQGALDVTQTIDGHLTERGADDFVYGSQGELLSATVGAQTVTYSYDAFGRRVARTVGGQTTRYLYGDPDNQAQLTSMVEPDNTLWTFFYDERGVLVALERGAATPVRYYVATDQVGSPRLIVDRDGVVVRRIDRDAWGRITNSPGATLATMPIGFAGGVEDPVTGLVRFGLRDYDPVLGRFTTRDPLLFGGGQRNLYAYAGSDPVRLVDPSGLVSSEVGICRGICVGVKFGITSKGLSACVSGGFGNSNALEFAPDGALEETRTGFKATGGVELGDLSLSVDAEATVEKCPEIKPPKLCYGKHCVGDITKFWQPDQWIYNQGDIDTKRKGGTLQGALVVFTCQALLF